MTATTIRWAKQRGFSDDLITYMICGGNTYEIKDFLKENGCKFDPLLKWHAPEKFDLPEGFVFEEIHFDNLYDYKTMPLDTARDFVLAIQNKYIEPSNSKYVGEVGDKLYDIDAVLTKIGGCQNYYGYQNIYTFETEDEDEIIWFTTKNIDVFVGDKIKLSGTVKKHNEYNGSKQTYMTRCKVEKID